MRQRSREAHKNGVFGLDEGFDGFPGVVRVRLKPDTMY